MGKDVIIACDFSSAEETMSFLDRFGDLKPYVKIGMELFYAEGPQIVRTLKARGHKVFLDLKLHDIPNTVGKAMSVLNGLGVDMCNVHAAGASEMMRAAAKAFAGSDTLVIAVTQLTSTSEAQLHEELLISSCMEETVRSYALNARKAGLDGVVCSPLESAAVHETCGKDFLTVTPGVRLAGDSKGDQKRVTTPAIARELGSDYIVVGRSITGADDPLQAYRQCVEEFIDR